MSGRNRSLLRFLADCMIAVGWAATLLLLPDIQTGGQWAVLLSSTFLAGLLSGRYRILALAIGGTVLAVTIVGLANTCQPPSCEDDMPLEVALLPLAVFATIPCAVMALGVFVRRLINGRDDGSWTSMSEP